MLLNQNLIVAFAAYSIDVSINLLANAVYFCFFPSSRMWSSFLSVNLPLWKWTQKYKYPEAQILGWTVARTLQQQTSIFAFASFCFTFPTLCVSRIISKSTNLICRSFYLRWWLLPCFGQCEFVKWMKWQCSPGVKVLFSFFSLAL